jgi:undecaprenyl-diphosphatase
MKLLDALIIAVVQGATEFLPVSSKAHDMLTARLLGVAHVPVEFLITIHLGTLVSVVVFYRAELWAMIRGLLRPVDEESRQWRRLLGLLILATIPAAIAGVAFENKIENALNQPQWHGLGLLVTACLLAAASRIKGTTPIGQVSLRQALLVGCAQACALLPGISRSGTTIVAGLGVGLEREAAPRFAFLLSVPTIFGGFLLEAKKVFEQGGGTAGGTGLYLLSAGVSAVVGYAAILLVMNSVRRGNLLYFAAYCLAVGLAVLLAGGRLGG